MRIDPKALTNWWEWLQDHKGDRAELRRAASPEEILLSEGFFHFLAKLTPKKETGTTGAAENLLVSADWIIASAMVAGVCAHVKINDEKKSRQNKGAASIAERLGTIQPGTGRPAASALRFQQLQQSRTPEIFYRRLLRSIRLLEGSVGLVSLADDIILWYGEFRWGRRSQKPAKRLAVRWASEYFGAL